MKKYFVLISVFALAACTGGSGGGGSSLTPAEQLFGGGMGTGATPTHLISRPDGIGNEILSFGAWGNVYDLRETSNRISIGGWTSPYNPSYIWLNVQNGSEVYDFTTQQNQAINTWGHLADASVSNATFTGPAIMYKGVGSSDYLTNSSDYGTMKVQFGYDIGTPARIEFVMSNPENNLVTNGASVERFSDDMNNIYIMKVIRGENFILDRVYRGYGHRN